MPIGTVLSSIFSKAASSVVDSVGNAFDKNFTTKEEREAAKLELEKEINRHFEFIESESTKVLEIELKDVSDARNREIQISTSEKAPLINKIITPILALLILGSCFLIWYIILFNSIPENKQPLVFTIVGSLTTISMTIVGYYFGSSIGSKDKGEKINKMIN